MMKFWTHSLGERAVDDPHVSLDEPPRRVVEVIKSLSVEEATRCGASGLIEETFSVEVRPDMEALGVLVRAIVGSALCYNIPIEQVTSEVADDQLALSGLNLMLDTAWFYVERPGFERHE